MSVDYQTYLASREWSLIREQVRERSRNECERCWDAPQQAVHHMTYENVGRESLDQLLAVCNPCHAWLSGKSNDDPAEVRLGQILFDRLDVAGQLFPSEFPKDGMQLYPYWNPKAPVPQLLARFCYSPSLESAAQDAYWVGGASGYYERFGDGFFNGWYVAPEVWEHVHTATNLAADVADAWAKFVEHLTMFRRGYWRFVPDARFNIYGRDA